MRRAWSEFAQIMLAALEPRAECQEIVPLPFGKGRLERGLYGLPLPDVERANSIQRSIDLV
jgi:hypothetical protein